MVIILSSNLITGFVLHLVTLSWIPLLRDTCTKQPQITVIYLCRIIFINVNKGVVMCWDFEWMCVCICGMPGILLCFTICATTSCAVCCTDNWIEDLDILWTCLVLVCNTLGSAENTYPVLYFRLHLYLGHDYCWQLV